MISTLSFASGRYLRALAATHHGADCRRSQAACRGKESRSASSNRSLIRLLMCLRLRANCGSLPDIPQEEVQPRTRGRRRRGGHAAAFRHGADGEYDGRDGGRQNKRTLGTQQRKDRDMGVDARGDPRDHEDPAHVPRASPNGEDDGQEQGDCVQQEAKSESSVETCINCNKPGHVKAEYKRPWRDLAAAEGRPVTTTPLVSMRRQRQTHESCLLPGESDTTAFLWVTESLPSPSPHDRNVRRWERFRTRLRPDRRARSVHLATGV